MGFLGTPIILARYLNHRLWLPLVQQGQAVVLGDERTPGGRVFTASSLDKPHVEIDALSGGEVLVHGLPVSDWQGPLVHHLFLYLVSHPLVARDELFKTF